MQMRKVDGSKTGRVVEKLKTNIFLISSELICMQLIISGNKAIMSLLLIVILATIFFKAIFFALKFLSFLPPLVSSRRSSATLPYRRYQY